MGLPRCGNDVGNQAMGFSVTRRTLTQRHKPHDSAIGWISFSDTLFLGFALLLLCSMKLASALKDRTEEASELRRSAAAVPADAHTRLKALSVDNDDLKTQLDSRTNELATARAALKSLEDSTAHRVTQEKRVRHELLGLKGKLRRVALVLDSSESMKRGDRWAKASEMVQQWVECLDMQACVVIVFHSHVYRHPKSGEFDFTTDREASIADIRNFLARFKPTGRTDTLAALEEAYRMDNVDTIILFTDGSPNIDDKAGSDKELVDRIYQLCRTKPDIPINAIGIGDYFKPEFSQFLLAIAEMTGGTFIGR